jgi:hypothetical protein
MSSEVYRHTLSYNFRASLTAYYSIGFHRSGNISPASYIAHSYVTNSYVTHSYIASFAGSITMFTTEIRFSTSYISEIYCCKKCLV